MLPAIRLLRPKQWIKNGFVFAPLCFSGLFFEMGPWQITLLAALAFLSVSCVVYVINDIRDREEDRMHPVKKNRPLAAAQLELSTAWIMATAMAGLGAFFLYFLPLACTVIAAVYIASNIVYTLVLKRIAIADIFFIAFCYVLRVLMGAYALAIAVSPWIILSTFMLALFLGFGKRFHEITIDGYATRKPNLQQYSHALLDRLVVISGGAALMSYAIYAAELAENTGRVAMIYTVGFVAFGLFRYLQSVYVYGQGGEPESIILRDKVQLINGVLWVGTTLWILF